MASVEVAGIARRRTPNQAPQAGVRRPLRREVPPTPVLDQRFDADTLHELRTAILGRAAGRVDADSAEEMVLVAHELATNAVRHGGGRGRLRMWAVDGRLRTEVSDNGPGLPDPVFAGTALPAPDRPGGRGLWIARTMSDLTIRTSPLGTTITAAIPRR